MGENASEFTSNNDREPNPIVQEESNYDIYVNLGKDFFEKHNYEAALFAYKCAEYIDDTNPTLYSDKAVTLRMLGRYEEALTAYDCVIALRPDDAAPYANKASVYREYGDYEPALKSYEAALNLDGKNVQYWRDKGDLLGELGFLEEAYKAYSEAISYEKDHEKVPFVYKTRADTLYELKRYEEALLDYDEAIGNNSPIRSWYQDRANAKNAIAKRIKEKVNEILQSALEDYEMAEGSETIEEE